MSEYADSAAFSLEHEDRPGLIVGLHGLTGNRSQPLSYLAGFDSPYFGVLAPDLRAHGDTPYTGRAEDFTPAQLAEDVIELLRRLGLASRPVCVLGVSLGATLALELVRTGALDVAAAVYIRPSHGVEPAPHLEVNATLASFLVEDPETALTRLLASDGYRRVAAVSESAAASLREKATKPRSAERAMRLARGALWSAFGTGERFETPPPSLIVAAPNDPLHPVGVAEAWRGRIAGSTIAMLPARDDDPALYAARGRSVVQEFIVAIAAARAAQATQATPK